MLPKKLSCELAAYLSTSRRTMCGDIMFMGRTRGRVRRAAIALKGPLGLPFSSVSEENN